MKQSKSPPQVVLEAEELLARARESLAKGRSLDAALSTRPRAPRRTLQDEQELRSFIFQQIAVADQKPLVEAPHIEPDRQVRFARSIRRRRAIV